MGKTINIYYSLSFVNENSFLFSFLMEYYRTYFLIKVLLPVPEAMLFCSNKDNIFIIATAISVTTWLSFQKSTLTFQYLSCFSGGIKCGRDWKHEPWILQVFKDGNNHFHSSWGTVFDSISWPGWEKYHKLLCCLLYHKNPYSIGQVISVGILPNPKYFHYIYTFGDQGNEYWVGLWPKKKKTKNMNYTSAMLCPHSNLEI